MKSRGDGDYVSRHRVRLGDALIKLGGSGTESYNEFCSSVLGVFFYTFRWLEKHYRKSEKMASRRL